ncbi:MAG: hypothetical protein KDD64_04535 [Bdellovibrionales bacterium]|nr:hypothetical protein [Bdellovibrionales bacterium]
MKDFFSTLISSLWSSTREATIQLKKSLILIPGMLVLLGVYLLVTFVAGRLGGVLGGFVVGLVQLLCLTLFYQWILEARSPRGLRLQDMKEFRPELFFALLSVAFPLFLIQLAMGVAFAPGEFASNGGASPVPFALALQLFIQLLIVILLNPAIEVLLLSQTQGVDAMARSMRFVIENWIEWLIPFIALMAPALLFATGLRGLLISAPEAFVIAIVGLFSATDVLLPITPVVKWWLVSLGASLSPAGNLLGMLWLIPALVLGAWFQLFRLHYYQSLEGSSRRSRIFRAKQGG